MVTVTGAVSKVTMLSEKLFVPSLMFEKKTKKRQAHKKSKKCVNVQTHTGTVWVWVWMRVRVGESNRQCLCVYIHVHNLSGIVQPSFPFAVQHFHQSELGPLGLGILAHTYELSIFGKICCVGYSAWDRDALK